MELSNAERAVIVRGEHDNEFLYLLMPVRPPVGVS